MDFLEINKPLFYIRVNELHLKPVAYIDGLIPAEQSTVDKAVKITRSVKGVKSVKNDLIVK